MPMRTVTVGKYTVHYTPELQLATVNKQGLLLPEVIHEEHGQEEAAVKAIQWAKDNQQAC